MNGLFKPKINVLGAEFSGVVESVGKNATRFRAGDDVFGSPDSSSARTREYIWCPNMRW